MDNICVRTCFDELGHVISAGAERITSTLGSIPDDLTKASYIDHTLLKADATREQVTQLCKEAREYHFASVCVNPTNVKLCASLLAGSDLSKSARSSVFRWEQATPETKAFEAQKPSTMALSRSIWSSTSAR